MSLALVLYIDINALRLVPSTISIDLKFGTKLLQHANYNICENEVNRFNFANSGRFFALFARVSSIFEQMTPFFHQNLSIMSILLSQNFKLSKQPQRYSVSNLSDIVKFLGDCWAMMSWNHWKVLTSSI